MRFYLAFGLAAFVGHGASRAQTVYDWIGLGNSNRWEEALNWTQNSHYPNYISIYDTARFGPGTQGYEVDITDPKTLSSIGVSGGVYTFTTSFNDQLAVTSGVTITGGTLRLGGTQEVFWVSTPLILNGGTFNTGATTGRTEGMGSLSWRDNDGTIALGTGSHNLSFASFGSVESANSLLSITGWTGTLGQSGGGGKLFVGTSQILSEQVLNQIRFTDIAGSPIAMQLTTGEIVPAPEPGTVLGVAAAGLGLAGWFRRKRLA